MIRRVAPLLVALAMCLSGCGSAGPATTPVGSFSTATVGTQYIAALAQADWSAAEAMEQGQMAAAAPAAKLATIWQSFEAAYGAFVSIGPVSVESSPPYTIAVVTTMFASDVVGLRVTVTTSGQVAGMFVGSVSAPSGSAAGRSAPPGAAAGGSAAPASYVRPGSFTETDVTVGSAPWALPGTLSMPNGDGPFPAVVLVAGSGPEDRNETYGPNAPLRDIAWGLASAGIAVLRYDKRTLVYASQMAAQEASLTVREEVTDDAVAAIGLLRTTSRVDPAHIFLVGHSLGAYLAPRIAAQAPGTLRGLALLEAPSTPLPALLLKQEQYLASLQTPSPDASAQLATLAEQVALAESPSLTASTPASSLPLGVPASYWLDLRSYDPLSTAAALDLPMFFSQGGRDYQVPPSELGPWRSALAGRSNVTFTTYPNMDHLLLDGSGPATPAEYGIPGHVAPELVSDLAAWIAAN